MKRRASTVLVTSSPVQRQRQMVNRNPLARTSIIYKPRYGRSLINPPRPYRTYPESKNCDIQGSTGNLGVNAWSEVDLLNGMIEGTDPNNNRIGRKINMTSIVLRYLSSTNLNGNPFRVLVVYDKQSDGALPTAASIVQDQTNILSPMNMNQSDRFVVIADEFVTQPSTFNGSRTMGSIFRKLNLPAHYQSNTALITGMASGSIYVLSCGIGGIGQGVGYFSRVRFTDT